MVVALAPRLTGPALLDRAGPVRVAYVAGAAHSGSTLLTRLLGAQPGAIALGDVAHLWQHGLVDGHRCECGAPVPACALWGDVLECAFGRLDGDEVDELRAAVDWLARPAHLREIHREDLARHPCIAGLAARLDRLYRAVAAVTGARLLVDDSRPPTYGRLLGTAPNLAVSVVHLVRDPRDPAIAATRPGSAEDAPAATRRVAGALHWSLWNGATETLFPYRILRVRYEDLVTDPASVLDRIGSFLDVPFTPWPDLRDRLPAVGAGHSLGPAHPDPPRGPRWPPGRRGVVTSLTGPLLRRYGYHLARPGVRRGRHLVPA